MTRTLVVRSFFIGIPHSCRLRAISTSHGFKNNACGQDSLEQSADFPEMLRKCHVRRACFIAAKKRLPSRPAMHLHTAVLMVPLLPDCECGRKLRRPERLRERARRA